MKKPLLIILVLVAAIAVAGGAMLFRQAQMRWSKAAFEKELAEMEAAAAKKQGVPKTEAMREAGLAKVAAKLDAAEGADEKAVSAAEIFFGYLYMNTKARVAYCRERGVDIGPFTRAFTEFNATELARANTVFAGEGVDPETLWPMAQEGMMKLVAQDMKDVSASVGVPLEKTCAFFNEHAAEIPPHIPFPADARAALMGGSPSP